MKNPIKLITLSTVILLSGCLEFNRDALWNAPINEYDYCTYFIDDFPIGSTFVHRQDSWTDKRINLGYELTVVQVEGNNLYILDHGWNVLYVDDILGIREIHHMPICVDTSIDGTNVNDNAYQVGDLFKSYGQYKYIENKVIKYGKKNYTMKCFKRINTSQDLAVEPYPFIYIR